MNLHSGESVKHAVLNGRALPVDFSVLYEPLPEAVLRAAANSPEVGVRFSLTAYRFVLPDDVFLQLIHDPEEAVREAAIRHWPATTEQIDAAVRSRPEMRAAAIGHPNGSCELMDDRSVGDSDGPDRRRYLDLVGAEPDERTRFLELVKAVTRAKTR